MTDRKAYLGDGAYVNVGSFDGEIELTTENGVWVTNRVILGPEEVYRLLCWIRSRCPAADQRKLLGKAGDAAR